MVGSKNFGDGFLWQRYKW